MRRFEGSRPRQTRIVATIGPCRDHDYPTYLQRLCEAGVDVMRLNMSHADAGYAKEREVLAWANRSFENHHSPDVAVMADLQGPKTRIGVLPEAGLQLDVGHTAWLVREGSTPAPELTAAGQSAPQIPVPEPLAGALLRGLRELLLHQPHPRPQVLFGDGDLIVEVEAIDDDRVRTMVVAGGRLGSRKGITVREIDLDLDPFPTKDQHDLQFCLEQGVDFVALSFVRTVADVERIREFIRQHMPAHGRPAPRLIAKIETLSALQHIEGILEASDGIMVARGDLGLQLGVEEVPTVQKALLAAAQRHGKPAIVATQMLESMIANPVPTRAEASDVFNAIVDGGDAVMLSGETSVGTRPYQVVATMDRIARKAEAWCRERDAGDGDGRQLGSAEGSYLQRINEAFAVTAVQFAEHLPARAVVCFTRTGRTPERLSRQRPTVPVLAFCSTPHVARTLLLYYGLHPVLLAGIDPDSQKRVMVDSARELLHRLYGMSRGEAIVLTAGIDWVKGGTNAVQVLVEDHKAANETPPSPSERRQPWRPGAA
jgi:pyruvate kinase